MTQAQLTILYTLCTQITPLALRGTASDLSLSFGRGYPTVLLVGFYQRFVRRLSCLQRELSSVFRDFGVALDESRTDLCDDGFDRVRCRPTLKIIQ